MSDTPLTDANEVEAIEGLGRCVGANFARELERENAALRGDKARLVAALFAIVHEWQTQSEACADNSHVAARMAAMAMKEAKP